MKIRTLEAELFHAGWQTELKIASFFPFQWVRGAVVISGVL